MKLLLLLCTFLAGLFFFAPSVPAQSNATPFVQVDILRVAPDDSAAFVTLVLPFGSNSAKPTVEVLSRQGEWEEVSLHYRFIFNGTLAPNGCARSLFDKTFTGFRKITESKY